MVSGEMATTTLRARYPFSTTVIRVQKRTLSKFSCFLAAHPTKCVIDKKQIKLPVDCPEHANSPSTLL